MLSFVQSVWPTDLSERQEMLFFVALIFLVHELVFWPYNILLLVADRKGWWASSKIQKGKYPSNSLLIHCVKLIAFNHFFIQPFGLLGLYHLFKAVGCRLDLPLPSGKEMLYHIIVFLITEDTLFYWSHRLLHHRLLFARIHKMHHRFHTSIGFAAEYAHPVEYLFSNNLPFLAGPILMRTHLLTLAVWLFIRIFETIDGHSGYDFWWMPFRYFPFRPGAEVHDFHHSQTKGNYASFFTFWDWLCGTDKNFKNFKKQEKERSMSNFPSASLKENLSENGKKD